MKRILAVNAWLVFFCFALANFSYALDMGIITGKEKGTYYQFGLDVKSLAEQHNIQLNVIPSNGSIDNIHAVYKKPGIQLGIVQSDVLAFITRVQTSELLKVVAKKTKMVFPLYNEEVHLLARAGISSFDDLSGKRVAIGEEGSGTYLTAKLLFEISKVMPKAMVQTGTDDALSKLKAGKIDAMFYVAGFPVKLFSESVTEKDQLKLVPITNQNILKYYPLADIPSNTYAWQAEPVNTVAVKAVLVSFDFKTGHCENVGKLAEIVSSNLDWLVQNGHPKWKAVDLEYELKGWQQYECARRFLVKHKRKDPAQLNPILDAIKEILENTAEAIISMVFAD